MTILNLGLSTVGDAFTNFRHNVGDAISGIGGWVNEKGDPEVSRAERVFSHVRENVSDAMGPKTSFANKTALFCHRLSTVPGSVIGEGFRFIEGLGHHGNRFIGSNMGSLALGLGTIGGAAYIGVRTIRNSRKIIVKETVRDARHPYGVDYVSINRGQLLRLAIGVTLVSTSALALWGGLYRFAMEEPYPITEPGLTVSDPLPTPAPQPPAGG